MSYELKIVGYFNKFFKQKNISAIAYRLKQARFCGQICDILVDSGDKRYYLAIQCKTTKYGLYFSSNFSDNQVKNISDFINISGRKGILVLKDRRQDYIIPWCHVESAYMAGKKSIEKQIIEKYKVDFNDMSIDGLL